MGHPRLGRTAVRWYRSTNTTWSSRMWTTAASSRSAWRWPTSRAACPRASAPGSLTLSSCSSNHHCDQLRQDIINSDSHNLLTRAGISFQRLKEKGISVNDFSEYLVASGTSSLTKAFSSTLGSSGSFSTVGMTLHTYSKWSMARDYLSPVNSFMISWNCTTLMYAISSITLRTSRTSKVRVSLSSPPKYVYFGK